MKNLKSILLGAVAVSGMASSGAFAQSTVAPLLVGSDLRGAGASAVQTLVAEAFNCISGNANAQQLGRGAPAHATLGVYGISADANSLPTAGAIQGGALVTIPGGVFTGAPTAISRCATPVQGNFKARYVSTGSGFGRDIWRSFSNRFTSGVTTTTNQSNPFEIADGTPTGDITSGWTNVQFAFSEGPISASDLATYNTNANSTTNLAGKAIQIPLYVVPVAVSYNRKYGVNAGTDLFFTVPTGGIKLNTAQYCGIYNGTIDNFNQLPSSSVSGSPADVPGRYASTAAGGGVPIRLVGRQDTSGTTDIFTRHLAAVCGTAPFNPVTGLGNKFTGPSASLPAAAVGTAIYSSTGVLLSGTEAPKLFARAPGNDGVAAVVALAPDVVGQSGVLLSGRLGYNSGDFVSPAPGAVNDGAQLTQVGSTTAFKAPNAVNATAAFATILPPQSIVSSGAYAATGDLRKNSVTGALVNRANPLDWADVLYSRADTSGGFTARTLAAPPLGYPMTGVSFMLTSTCFKNPANRVAIAQFLYTNLKKIKYDDTISSGTGNVSVNLLSGTAGTGTARGLTAQSNLAPLSAGWQKAIFDTFLVKTTTGGLGARGLWIQNAQPTTAATVATLSGNTGGTDSNVGGVAAAACTANAGA